MLEKIPLYAWTIRYMKPSQVFWRIKKRLGGSCGLKGCRPTPGPVRQHIKALPELDWDPAFLKRFSVEELMEDWVTFLYEAENICWDGPWCAAHRSPLWNFNLHYFEYLHPLTARWQETGDACFLDKTVRMIRGWIQNNPKGQGGPGWASYTISLRLTNWMAYLSVAGQRLQEDFLEELEASMFEQYVWLSGHLEKDILGNHYFENLKTLVLCAHFFADADALAIYLPAFRKECREEILPDGMHFELSPMYHKIVLEGLIRVAAVLEGEWKQPVQDMLDAVYSMEGGLSRTPLFNDSGDNVAKSLDGLLAAAKNHLGLVPARKAALPSAGYYFFEAGPWKLIVDSGQPGPDYIPGHSHCDAMSFELYREGEPWLVNCGTYAYQCKERGWFRSTRAHNTVQTEGTEQSEIWSTFRLARRSHTKVLELRETGLRMEMTDYKGNRIVRDIQLYADSLVVCDTAQGKRLQSHLHSLSEIQICSNVPVTYAEAMYAPEYGRLHTINHITATGSDRVELQVTLP